MSGPSAVPVDSLVLFALTAVLYAGLACARPSGIFSGCCAPDTLLHCKSQHPSGFLQKPFSPGALYEALRAALEK